MELLSINSQTEPILFYVFIGIFVITAFLTLASLPNWIKLDEWYRKKLFLALILEVIGIIVMAGGKIFTDKDQLTTQTNWIALNENGEVISPIANKDSTQFWGSRSLNGVPNLKMELNIDPSNELNLLVKSSDDVTLGRINSAILTKAGLFNLLSDIDSPNQSANIRWEKIDGKWKRVDKTINKMLYRGFIDKEVGMEVYDSQEGTKYRLYDRVDTIFLSDPHHLDARYRIIHFCKNSENKYYMFRITSANLQDQPEFVNILQIRLDPKLNFCKK